MCGFVGYVKNTGEVAFPVLEAMVQSQHHRGPDGTEYYISNDKKTALGHNRLAIIDLTEAGKQPMSNEDESVWLVSNGEIYNYRELRKQLAGKGHRFKSNTDIEVILHGYEEWGVEVVNKLEGMFAFGIWDEKQKKTLLARDRFGIKPIYYLQDKDRLVFASEIKGIISDRSVEREIDTSALIDFLTYRYVPSPKSIWKGIKKLPPAHFAEFELGEVSKISKYWDLPKANKNIPFNQVVEQANGLLDQSVRKHLLSDVPLGLFLSGGIDSCTMAYFMDKQGYHATAFTIGFEGWERSEHKQASLVAKTFNHRYHEKLLNEGSIEILSELAYHYDEPLADVSVIPTYLNSKEASRQVKSVLSGDGGDEVFAGYNWHKGFVNEQQLSAVEYYTLNFNASKINHSDLRQLLNDDWQEVIEREENWLYQERFEHGLSPVKSLQFLDYRTFLTEMVLTKVDRASMACSMEVRVPFLDHKLVEYMISLDESIYFNEGYNKVILREILKTKIDDSILDRPKSGFVGPDNLYQDADFFRDLLIGGSLLKDRLIKQPAIDNWLKIGEFNKLWSLAVLETWYTTWKH